MKKAFNKYMNSNKNRKKQQKKAISPAKSFLHEN